MKKTNKGFTLVELIIVIAVIGVLAAILIPVFANVIDKANQKSAMSDARNAFTEFTAEITDGAGVSMPDSMMFVQKGNKMYAFGFSANNGFKAYDEEGYDMVTRYADDQKNYDATVTEYAQVLRAEGVVQMSRSANPETMYAAFKTLYPNDALATRATYAELSSDEQLQVMHSMIQNIGFDPNTMVLQFSYTPTANFFGNTEVVAPVAAGTTFMVNGVTTHETNIQTVVDNAPAGSTIRLYQDVTVTGSPLNITKDIVIDGNGHTLTTAPGVKRAIWIDEFHPSSLTIKNLVIDGANRCERAVQVNCIWDDVHNVWSGEWVSADVTLINCEIKGMTYYAVNLCTGTKVDLVVKNTKITGWAAINAYGSGNKILVQDSELVGLNNKSYNSWNNFSTVCLEGDSTGATEAGSEDYIVNIENSKLVATQTTGNQQQIIGFNQNSKNCIVTVKNCDIVSNCNEIDPDGDAMIVYQYGTNNTYSFTGCTFNGMAEGSYNVFDFDLTPYGYEGWSRLYMH